MSQSLEQGKRKLTAKDAITAGALGAVCIAIRFLFMLVGGVSPYAVSYTHLHPAGQHYGHCRAIWQRQDHDL